MNNETLALELDLKSLRCPMPLLKTKQALNQVEVGDVICVTTTDPGSKRDFKSYIDLSQHELCGFEDKGDEFVFFIKKGT